MKAITEKVLKSGLVDKHMALMLEKWGALPDGAADLVNDDALKDATREQLTQLGVELGDEVDKLRTLKETQLDLDKIRWPAECDIVDLREGRKLWAAKVQGVIDRTGRIYFRFDDVMEAWFIPGFIIERSITGRDGHKVLSIQEQIVESTVLYTDEIPVCIQVSVVRLA